MKKQQGFTLIELMIVVAIIAILAAIAISQYQDYVIRSQVSEGSSLADGTKTAVAEFYNNYGRFAADNESYGLSDAGLDLGKYVTQVDAANGQIAVTFGNQAHTAIIAGADTLVFSPIPHARFDRVVLRQHRRHHSKTSTARPPAATNPRSGCSTRRAAQAALLFCEGGHTPHDRYGTLLAS